MFISTTFLSDYWRQNFVMEAKENHSLQLIEVVIIFIEWKTQLLQTFLKFPLLKRLFNVTDMASPSLHSWK